MSRLFVADRRDWLRLVGGLIFAAGAVVLAVRKGGAVPVGGDGADPWGDVALLFVLLIPFALLYGLGILGRAGGAGAQPWQSVFLVFAVLLFPLVGFQFLEVVDGDPDAPLNSVWIFGVTAALGVFAAIYTGATPAGGLGALAAIVAWLALWNEILGDDDFTTDTLRWLLVIIAAIYIGIVVLARAWPRAGQISGLVTAAGVAAVVAGSIGAFAALGALLNPLGGAGLPANIEGAKPGVGWDIFLGAASAALIGFSARTGRRGPGLVGAFGLAIFIFVVGAEITEAVKEGMADGKLVGWPLILLLLGAAALAASFLIPPGTLDRLLGPGARGGPASGDTRGQEIPPAPPPRPAPPPPPRQPPPPPPAA